MDLYCEKRSRLAGEFVQLVGVVGTLVLVLAIWELPYFRAMDWTGWLLPIVFASSSQWLVAYIWGCFIKTDRVTSEEIVSTTKYGTWRRNSSLQVPISVIAEASMVEHGTTAVRGDGCGSIVYQESGDIRGVRLLLKDGSSRFIGFEYPAKALAAIQEAMNTPAAK